MCMCSDEESLAADMTETYIQSLQLKDSHIVELENHIQKLMSTLELTESRCRSVICCICLEFSACPRPIITISLNFSAMVKDIPGHLLVRYKNIYLMVDSFGDG